MQDQQKPPLLFCNIGWMEWYQGLSREDTIRGGGAYVEASETGREVCNFATFGDELYGYVKPPGEQIQIERLGAGRSEDHVAGVTVVWTATAPEHAGTLIVGWYRNAVVFRRYQRFSETPALQKENGIDGYWIMAEEKDGFLLPVPDRKIEVPRGEKGGMGQSNIWYGDTPGSSELVGRIQSFMSDVESRMSRTSLRIRAEKSEPVEPPQRVRKRIKVGK